MQSMLLSRPELLLRHGRFMSAKRRARIAARLCVEPVRIADGVGLPRRRSLELDTYVAEDFTVPIQAKGTPHWDEGAAGGPHDSI